MLNNLPQPGPVNHATGKSNPVVRIKHCRIEGQPLNMIMVPMAVEDQRFMPPIKGDMAKTGSGVENDLPAGNPHFNTGGIAAIFRHRR